MIRLFRGALYTLVLLFIILPEAAAAPGRDPDSNYVLKFPGTLTLRTYLGEKFSTYTLIDRATGRELAFHPNNILGLGLGVTIMGIGINFSTRLPLHDPKTDLFGKTTRYDIQLHRYSRKLMLDGYFQRYRGFHFPDSSEVTTVSNPEAYPYFANLEGRSIGISALHIFNGARYSLRALVSQQEWQVKSSGSALLGGSVFTHRFSEQDSSVIPRNYKYADFLGGNRPVTINYYGITVNGGYGYTLVLDRAAHFFIAGAADIGVGGGQSSVRDTHDARLTKIGLCLSGNLRAGGGYNSEKWFAGIYGIYHTDYYALPYEKSAMQSRQGLVRLVVARRLATKKRYLARQPKHAAASQRTPGEAALQLPVEEAGARQPALPQPAR
jgi:hypothetical protein